MKIYATSSPGGVCYDENAQTTSITPLDERNDFVDSLRKDWKAHMKVIVVCAAPDELAHNDDMVGDISKSFALSGLEYDCFDICDRRKAHEMVRRLNEYDLIIFSGGHVPTQNKFFDDINIRDVIGNYNGLVMGISAGTMNLAGDVYAMPELEGESLDEKYKRFIKGLGLTDYMIIPHFQYIKCVMLDGKNMIEDIAMKDSFNHRFICINDGSYIITENGENILHGEAYVISDGKMEKICEEGQWIDIKNIIL